MNVNKVAFYKNNIVLLVLQFNLNTITVIQGIL